ncbi:DUF6152 family protein [Paracoccaceae bacterium Fryx2]|nr:DUF6152 family protein [Paracoccaceae bacterium Fryx2]
MKRALPFLIIALAAVPATAHHGWGSYNADAPITIAGEIEDITLGNPHGEMTVPHDGAPWLITLAPLTRMNARGATEAVLKVGVEVTAHGYPKSDGTAEIRAEWVEVDGRRYELR